jgi:hypothetical protein
METKIYSTKDFYLSALLLSYDYKMLDSQKKNEGVYFNFYNHDNDLLQKLLSDFVNYSAMVHMRKFTSAMSKLRKELDKYR